MWWICKGGRWASALRNWLTAWMDRGPQITLMSRRHPLLHLHCSPWEPATLTACLGIQAQRGSCCCLWSFRVLVAVLTADSSAPTVLFFLDEKRTLRKSTYCISQLHLRAGGAGLVCIDWIFVIENIWSQIPYFDFQIPLGWTQVSGESVEMVRLLSPRESYKCFKDQESFSGSAFCFPLVPYLITIVKVNLNQEEFSLLSLDSKHFGTRHPAKDIWNSCLPWSTSL